MRFKYIERFELGEGFFRREGEKSASFEGALVKEIGKALNRKLGREPALSYFFAHDPYVDCYLTAKQAKRVIEHLKSDIMEDPKYESFLPFIDFLEENVERGGFFVFFSD